MPTCNICQYSGKFIPAGISQNPRRCPKCRSLKRHRDNWAMIQSVEIQGNTKPKMLMVSVDPYLDRLRSKYDMVILIKGNTVRVPNGVLGDILYPPFDPKSFDVVMASHVLEHIKDDDRALREIHKLVKPGGYFLSNVPCTSKPTNEFKAAEPKWGHWRNYGRQDYMAKLTSTGFVDVTNVAGGAFCSRRPKG